MKSRNVKCEKGGVKKVEWSTVPLELAILLGRCPELMIPTMKKTMNEKCEKISMELEYINLKACPHLHTDPHRIRIRSTSILSALESTSKRSRSDRDPPDPHQEVDSIRIRSRLARQKRIHFWVCRNIT